MKENYYIYSYFSHIEKSIFYIGMGHGNRKYETKKRNKYFRDIYNNGMCELLILETNLTYEEALKREVFYIKHYKPVANLTKGGERTNGKKISEKLKGRTLPRSHKDKLKIAAKNQRRSMINNKKVVVLDRNRKVVKEFEAKYQVGIWLHQEFNIGKNVRSAQRIADRYFKSGTLFSNAFYFEVIN